MSTTKTLPWNLAWTRDELDIGTFQPQQNSPNRKISAEEIPQMISSGNYLMTKLLRALTDSNVLRPSSSSCRLGFRDEPDLNPVHLDSGSPPVFSMPAQPCPQPHPATRLVCPSNRPPPVSPPARHPAVLLAARVIQPASQSTIAAGCHKGPACNPYAAGLPLSLPLSICRSSALLASQMVL